MFILFFFIILINFNFGEIIDQQTIHSCGGVSHILSIKLFDMNVQFVIMMTLLMFYYNGSVLTRFLRQHLRKHRKFILFIRNLKQRMFENPFYYFFHVIKEVKFILKMSSPLLTTQKQINCIDYLIKSMRISYVQGN